MDEIPVSEIVGPCTVVDYAGYRKLLKNNKPPRDTFYVKRCVMKAFSFAPLADIDFKLFMKGPTWRVKKTDEELMPGLVKKKSPVKTQTPKKEQKKTVRISRSSGVPLLAG